MSVHEQFADDLSLYAIGALEGEDRLALERHLRQCPECSQELQKLRGDVSLLALSVSGPKPPARSRERLMAAIRQEPRRIAVARASGKRFWRPVEWAFAAAAVIVLLLLVRQNHDLRDRVADLQSVISDQQQHLEQAQELAASLTSIESERFTLVANHEIPQPQGKVIYSRARGTVVFLASNMPKLPPQKTYELWLIPVSGSPIPAGLIHPDQRGGGAMVIKPNVPSGIEAKTFAITVEPEEGSSSPTSKPVMVGVQS